ncbi:unnamed protein product [Rhizophagus irregularis]|nr:unnamed protein product [Rhizophagus irregularis]
MAAYLIKHKIQNLNKVCDLVHDTYFSNNIFKQYFRSIHKFQNFLFMNYTYENFISLNKNQIFLFVIKVDVNE